MFREIGDLRVHYDVRGDGDALMLVHGGGADSQTWEEMVPHLAGEYNVYTFDLRGFGRTVRPPDPKVSLDLWAEDVYRFMASFGLKKASFAGWSLGGAVILNLAARQPNAVSKLILIGTPSPLRPLDRSGFDRRQKMAESGASIEEIVEETFEFTKNAFSPHTLKNNPNAVEKIRQALLRNEPSDYSEMVKVIGTIPELAPKLGSIKHPTLIIVGDADARTPVEMANDLHKAIEQSYVKTIPRCGHFYGYEQPELTSRAIIDFLKTPQ